MGACRFVARDVLSGCNRSLWGMFEAISCDGVEVSGGRTTRHHTIDTLLGFAGQYFRHRIQILG